MPALALLAQLLRADTLGHTTPADCARGPLGRTPLLDAPLRDIGRQDACGQRITPLAPARVHQRRVMQLVDIRLVQVRVRPVLPLGHCPQPGDLPFEERPVERRYGPAELRSQGLAVRAAAIGVPVAGIGVGHEDGVERPAVR
ncbi:hypothetical protein [Streptomyces sp. NPDC051567]|uniref:hypothetical protein n=1 Tax=Streptomyces sp. NPDC051567 TaxID=3365660 RepID=UPI0037947A72